MRRGLLIWAAVSIACASEPRGDEAEDASTGIDGGSTSTEADGGFLDDDSTGSDGGQETESPADGDSTGAPPEPRSPVFVAIADGGWTATSCDGGQTWSQQAFSDEVGDHTPWTGFGGVAFGNGAFVAGFGWGAPGHLLHSSDGLEWEDLPAENFTHDGRVLGYDAWTAGVAFDGSEHVVFSQRVWRSSDGRHWEPADDVVLPPGSDQLRQLRGFDGGVLVAALESQSGEGHPVGNFIAVSTDGGQGWTEGPGYSASCGDGIQHWGDIERRGDTLIVATRDVCRSTDLGQSWELVPDPVGGEIQDVFVDAAGFGAAVGSRVFHSDDGITWSETADLGVPLSKAAHGDGAWVAIGAMGTETRWSTDGVSWQPGTFEEPPSSEVWVRDLVVGYPSDCARGE